jgi:hypothetical protein
LSAQKQTVTKIQDTNFFSGHHQNIRTNSGRFQKSGKSGQVGALHQFKPKGSNKWLNIQSHPGSSRMNQCTGTTHPRDSTSIKL